MKNKKQRDKSKHIQFPETICFFGVSLLSCDRQFTALGKERDKKGGRVEGREREKEGGNRKEREREKREVRERNERKKEK